MYKDIDIKPDNYFITDDGTRIPSYEDTIIPNSMEQLSIKEIEKLLERE